MVGSSPGGPLGSRAFRYGVPTIGSSGHDGIEVGTFSWDPVAHRVTSTTTVDTNGDWGLSDPVGILKVVLPADGLAATGHDDSDDLPASFTRIVDPNAVKPVINSSLSETGKLGTPFTYTMTIAEWPAGWPTLGISASGLPTGLTFNAATSVISGTPTEIGTFHVALTASNTLNDGPRASTATLNLVIDTNIRRMGFYEPVSPVADFVNTVKGGSIVPLKFNVYVSDVEQTDTAGLQFTVASLPCSGGTEDPVDFVTTGGTSLRYDTTAHQFIQNWKTPATPGACYVVRTTTTADGLSLSAKFKMK